METFLIVMFLVVSVFMTLVILIQKPKGGGLSGAFGGAGGGAQTAFGSKTGDVLTWFTTACFVLFLVLGVVLTLYIEPVQAGGKTGVQSNDQTQTDGDTELPPFVPDDGTGAPEGDEPAPTPPAGDGGDTPTPAPGPAKAPGDGGDGTGG
jgi:preprotein translocase subunit SecG